MLVLDATKILIRMTRTMPRRVWTSGEDRIGGYEALQKIGFVLVVIRHYTLLTCWPGPVPLQCSAVVHCIWWTEALCGAGMNRSAQKRERGLLEWEHAAGLCRLPRGSEAACNPGNEGEQSRSTTEMGVSEHSSGINNSSNDWIPDSTLATVIQENFCG